MFVCIAAERHGRKPRVAARVTMYCHLTLAVSVLASIVLAVPFFLAIIVSVLRGNRRRRHPSGRVLSTTREIYSEPRVLEGQSRRLTAVVDDGS